MADGVMFVTSPDALVDARATSKKSTQMRRRLDSLRKIYDAAGRLTAAHEKFPVDLGHKQM
jgi:hypothetical protein